MGLAGILLQALIPRIHFPKHTKHRKLSWRRDSVSVDDGVQSALLCQLSHRITDKLRSAYPQALWDWERQPDIQRILSGRPARICLIDADEYTHAEIRLDPYGDIHLQLLKIEDLSRKGSADSDTKDQPADCASWYELVGASVLKQVITDLNARGYEQLSINEAGDIFITEGTTPVIKEHFQNFPGKKHWPELVSIFQENELQAEATDTALVLSWGN